MELFLSKSSMFLIKYVAELLGVLMNGIYIALDAIGIANISLCIVIFTIIIYILLTPIQIKQQKSSKVMSAVQPELQAIQAKYQGKRDAATQQKMQEETMALYKKYGVSPTGSCLPLLIQMPILFALYQVILYIPGYVNRVAQMFEGVANKIMSVDGAETLIQTFISDNKIRTYGRGSEITVQKIIDMMYILKPAQWVKLETMPEFSAFSQELVETAEKSRRINSLFGVINIAESPLDAIRSGFGSIVSGNASAIAVAALVIGILIPVLAWFTQWINMKLMPQQPNANDKNNTMAASMNTMNTTMPIFSAVMCLTFNMGIGVYWIIGAVVRCVQQVVINRRIGSIDMKALEAKAAEKAQKETEKQKNYVNNVTQNARTNVKRIQNAKSNGKDLDSSQFYRDSKDLNPDSITAKANWVKAFDENNKKK